MQVIIILDSPWKDGSPDYPFSLHDNSPDRKHHFNACRLDRSDNWKDFSKNSGITPTSYFVCCRSHRPHCVDHLQLLVPSWSHSCLLLPPRHDEIQKGQSRSGRRIGKNPGKNVRILGHFLPHCFPHILYYIQYCVLDKLFIKSHVVNHFSFLV